MAENLLYMVITTPADFTFWPKWAHASHPVDHHAYREVDAMYQQAYAMQQEFASLAGALFLQLGRRLPLRRAVWQRPGHPESTLLWSSDDLASPSGQTGDTEFPLRFGRHPMGMLQLVWRDAVPAHPDDESLLEHFIWRLQLLLGRYEFRARVRGQAAQSSLLVGAGQAITHFEQQLELCARSTLPTWISAEFGTDPSAAALALHHARHKPEAPFVEVLGIHPWGDMADWFERAQGGTLFLNGIEHFSLETLLRLPLYLHSRFGQWQVSEKRYDCHVISSSAHSLESLYAQSRMPRPLLVELSQLCMHVPPLRARMDDLAWLVQNACIQVEAELEGIRKPELMEPLRRYTWPENQLELTRLIAHLALLAQGREVHYGDLMQCAPHIGLGQSAQGQPDPGEVGAPPNVAPPPERQPGAREGLPDAGSRLAGDDLACLLHTTPDVEVPQALSSLPKALQRALQHLACHYAEPLTATELARVACLSVSHLTAVFRRHLGTSFKTLLQQLRILQARKLLLQGGPQRITEIAMEVGFNDLSHFERCFRRWAGCSPREYRLRHAEDAGAD